jgi:hypothetical protein
MDIRLILASAWLMPLAAVAGLLYYEFKVPAAALPETNRVMRERMCKEHVELARTGPSNDVIQSAIEECVNAGYITHAQGITAID